MVLIIAGMLGGLSVAAAQTDAGGERTKQRAGESGAAASHTLTPGPGEAREITATATGSVSLTPDQRAKLKDFFSRSRTKGNEADDKSFTVSVGAAVPKQIPLQALGPELKQILPRFQGDQYVIVQGELVIAAPDDRRIVAIIPAVKG
jgi:hypothetical protein